MPTARATASAVVRASPVSSHTSTPAARSSRTASADAGRTGSATAIRPAAAPSTATNTTVPPSAAAVLAGSTSAARSTPRSVISRRLPTATSRPPTVPTDAASDDGLEPVDRLEAELALARPPDDRLAEGMLGPGLERGREVQQLRRREPGGGHDGRDLGPAEGEGAGLVEDHGVDAPGGLERLAAAHEDPRLGPLPRPDHDRGRRGEAHGARAGDDHDPDEGREGEREARLRADQHPGDERQRRDHEDQRHEHLAHPVGEPLDRRLGALGALDQLDDPREGGLATHVRRAHHERARGVDRGADDLVAGRLGDRDRLAGEHGLVDGRGALDHDAVDRHLVARPDPQQVARARPSPARRPRQPRRGRGGPSSPGARPAAGSPPWSAPSPGPRATARAGPGR